MIRHGEEVDLTTEEASGGQKRGIVRYVLIISTLLAIVAMSIIWITGASNSDEGSTPNSEQSASDPALDPAGD